MFVMQRFRASNERLTAILMMKYGPDIKLLTCLCLSASVTASAAAQVTWDERQYELRTQPGTERVSRGFGFRNAGEEPLTVTSVESSCGCTLAELAQTVYGPGEAGRIDVTFELGDRKGRQIKKVVVRTDDPATPVTTLTLDVTIPRPVELTPRLLHWRADEPRERKTLEVALNHAEPVELAGLKLGEEGTGGANGLKGEVEELEPGRRYRVTVAPPADGMAVRQIIWLQTRTPGGETAVPTDDKGERDPAYRFLVRVDAPAAAAPAAEATDEAEPGEERAVAAE